MADFINPPTHPKAGCDHRCAYCSGLIPKGETHHQQTGNYDGSWFANRYHDECWSELNASGDYEFMPGEGDIPERIVRLTAQRAQQREGQ